MSDDLQDPMSVLAEGAAQIHEMFLSYQEAGFTEQQALYLVGCAIKAMLAPPAAGGG
jgi:hypothetical protein